MESFRQPSGHAVLDLVRQADDCLGHAAAANSANERFAAAHLGALRAGAAVLAARAQPPGPRRTRPRSRGPRNVWEVLPQVAPELSEWAAFFGAKAGKRAAAQASIRGAVTDREADDLLRSADTFLGAVCGVLGLPFQAPVCRSSAALAVN
jgi:hypothetical protein